MKNSNSEGLSSLRNFTGPLWKQSLPVVLSLWVATPLWLATTPFTGVAHSYQKTQILTLGFITAAKLQL